MTALAPTLPAFFRDRLIDQRQANPHTIAAYRDTLRALRLCVRPARQGALEAEHRRLQYAAGRRLP